MVISSWVRLFMTHVTIIQQFFYGVNLKYHFNTLLMFLKHVFKSSAESRIRRITTLFSNSIFKKHWTELKKFKMYRTKWSEGFILKSIISYFSASMKANQILRFCLSLLSADQRDHANKNVLTFALLGDGFHANWSTVTTPFSFHTAAVPPTLS